MREYSPWTDPDYQRAVEMYADGASYREISVEIGRPIGSIKAKIRMEHRHLVPVRIKLHAERRVRPCMCCKRDFVSEWRGNRLCGECKRGEMSGGIDL